MNKYLSKISSFLILVLLLILCLNQFDIISYSNKLDYILYFITLILIIFSSTSGLLTNKSGFFKFVNGTILCTLLIGGVLIIIKPGLNVFIYISIISNSLCCIVDMFCKT